MNWLLPMCLGCFVLLSEIKKLPDISLQSCTGIKNTHPKEQYHIKNNVELTAPIIKKENKEAEEYF